MHNIKLKNSTLKRQGKAIMSVVVIAAFLFADFGRAYGYGPAFAGAFAGRHSRPAELRPLASAERNSATRAKEYRIIRDEVDIVLGRLGLEISQQERERIYQNIKVGTWQNIVKFTLRQILQYALPLSFAFYGMIYFFTSGAAMLYVTAALAPFVSVGIFFFFTCTAFIRAGLGVTFGDTVLIAPLDDSVDPAEGENLLRMNTAHELIHLLRNMGYTKFERWTPQVALVLRAQELGMPIYNERFLKIRDRLAGDEGTMLNYDNIDDFARKEAYKMRYGNSRAIRILVDIFSKVCVEPAWYYSMGRIIAIYLILKYPPEKRWEYVRRILGIPAAKPPSPGLTEEPLFNIELLEGKIFSAHIAPNFGLLEGMTEDERHMQLLKATDVVVGKIKAWLLKNGTYSLGGILLGRMGGAYGRDPHLFDAVMNNALEAMERSRKKGRIVVRAIQLENEIILEVLDEGDGLSKEALEKVFTENYSVQEKGRRHGLYKHGLEFLRERNGCRVEISSCCRDGTFRGRTYSLKTGVLETKEKSSGEVKKELQGRSTRVALVVPLFKSDIDTDRPHFPKRPILERDI